MSPSELDAMTEEILAKLDEQPFDVEAYVIQSTVPGYQALAG